MFKKKNFGRIVKNPLSFLSIYTAAEYNFFV